MAGGISLRGQNLPRAPESARVETQHDDATVRAKNSVHLSEQRMGRRRQLKRMRQENRVHGRCRDRQRVGVAEHPGGRVGAPIQEGRTLRAGITGERILAPP